MQSYEGGVRARVPGVLFTLASMVGAATAGGVVPEVTFHRDILPVLQERCQPCHRPGEIGPFSLLTYSEARRWAGEISASTADRTMPPWLAAPGHGDFQGERRLTEREVGLFSRWVDGGLVEGRAEEGPPARTWPERWALGKPDVVLEPVRPYALGASGDDEFRVFVLQTGLLEDREVAAIDFRPGNARVVHHAVIYVDPSHLGRHLDALQRGPGYSSGPGGPKVPGAEVQGVWAPGNRARFLPQGVSRLLPAGADLLLQVHYHRTGKPETDRTRVGLYFARTPAPRRAYTIGFGPLDIDIPPGARRHEVRLRDRLDFEVQLLTIMPHMHLLGREMRVTATRPDGTTLPLLWVPRWDYRWQDSFRYREPVTLPRGTVVELTATFDNSAENPRNPNVPPRRVRSGDQTTDEMALAIMEVVPGGPIRPPASGE